MNLKPIPFTQFMLPNGARRSIEIERPEAITEKAEAIIKAGFRFEVEILSTGHVSLTITGDNIDVAIRVVSNGFAVAVAAAVDDMIENFDIDEAKRRDEEAA